MFARLVLTLSILGLANVFAAPAAQAASSLPQYRIGVLLGDSKLASDPAFDHSNAFAYGLTLGSLLMPSLGVNLDIVTTTHPDVDHREVSLGVDYYFWSEDNLAFDPRLTGGFTRISNTLKTLDLSASTFGIFVGVGVDWRGWEGWRPGLELRYDKVIPTETNRITGEHLTTVGDSASLMFRLLYEFAEFGWD